MMPLSQPDAANHEPRRGDGTGVAPTDCGDRPGARHGDRQPVLWARILFVVVVGVVIEAWFPFRPELPWSTRVAPDRGPGGLVTFGGAAVLTGSRPQAWVADAAASSTLQIDLEVRTDRADQKGPARLLTVTRDVYAADLMIGQEHADLVVRLRRAGSDPSGEPPYRVVGVFEPPGWKTVKLRIDPGVIDITVTTEDTRGGGVVRDVIGPTGLSSWNSSYKVAIGDEPNGLRGWSGQIRRAAIVTPNFNVDLLDSDALTPGRGKVFSERWRTATSLSTHDPLAWSLLRALVFVPIGIGLRKVRPLRRSLTLNSAQIVLLATALGAGKLFVAGRHPALSDVMLNIAGGLLGIFFGQRAWSRWRPRQDNSGGSPLRRRLTSRSRAIVRR